MARARGGQAGGITGLVALIERDGEALDAALQAEYGLGLEDVAAGRVTFRRLGGLVRGLPSDGTAIWRKHRLEPAPQGRKATAPPDDWWTPERDLLAGIQDALTVLAWQRTKDAERGQNFPKPIPRPGVRAEASPARRMPPKDAMALLARVAGRDTALN